jgi:hypothetical protein
MRIVNNVKKSGQVLGIVFSALVILQFCLAPLIPIVFDINKYVNYPYFHATISYTTIVLSIIFFGNSGLEVFQDHFSLGIIALTCFLRVGLGGSNEIVYKGITAFLGLVLLNYIITNRKRIKIPSLKTVIIGLVWAIGTVMTGAFLRIFMDSNHGTLPLNLGSYVINMFIFQITDVTVIEEAYFRGLLFGFLVMNGYKENAALFIQGILFWIIHFMKIGDPILFFILLPIFTLSTTLIIKKYKMLYLSILIHTFNNVFGGILVAIL